MRGLLQRVSQEVILPRYRNLSANEIADKGKNELVTIADRESEAMLAEDVV